MLTRREWLRRTSLALAGGLVLGPEALEAFERLTHRKIFALGGLPKWGGVGYYFDDIIQTSSLHGLSTSTAPLWRAAFSATTPEFDWLKRVDPANGSGWREILGEPKRLLPA